MRISQNIFKEYVSQKHNELPLTNSNILYLK